MGIASLLAHGLALAALVPSAHRPGAARDAPAPTEQILAGETFEIPGESASAAGVGAVTNTGPSAADEVIGVPARIPIGHVRPPADLGASANAEHLPRPHPSDRQGRESTANEKGGPAPGTFGAQGDRSANDLASAFTRSFPIAASADPAWPAARLGDGGEAEVVITLSASGSLMNADVRGAPPLALASGIRRTLALLKSRVFTARGAVTRLRVQAHVARDQVHDGLHGDVFAVGGSFEAREGNAFFALAVGRRIDIRVTERR